jgi:hypothetical protein
MDLFMDGVITYIIAPPFKIKNGLCAVERRSRNVERLILKK